MDRARERLHTHTHIQRAHFICVSLWLFNLHICFRFDGFSRRYLFVSCLVDDLITFCLRRAPKPMVCCCSIPFCQLLNCPPSSSLKNDTQNAVDWMHTRRECVQRANHSRKRRRRRLIDEHNWQQPVDLHCNAKLLYKLRSARAISTCAVTTMATAAVVAVMVCAPSAGLAFLVSVRSPLRMPNAKYILKCIQVWGSGESSCHCILHSVRARINNKRDLQRHSTDLNTIFYSYFFRRLINIELNFAMRNARCGWRNDLGQHTHKWF